MNWKKIEAECKVLFENHKSGFIPLERRFIIQVISEEFPDVPRVRIAAVVDKCLELVEKPITRTAFIRFMQANLEPVHYSTKSMSL